MTKRILTLAVAALALFAVGCGGEESDTDAAKDAVEDAADGAKDAVDDAADAASDAMDK